MRQRRLAVRSASACRTFDRHWNASIGVDNLLNRTYFYFHPFPMRTFVGRLKYSVCSGLCGRMSRIVLDPREAEEPLIFSRGDHRPPAVTAVPE